MDNLLTISNLDIWYRKGSPVIRDLTLTLLKNEVVGLIGLNGAGKTTLINTLSGIHKDYSGGMNFADRAFKANRYTQFPLSTGKSRAIYGITRANTLCRV